MTKTKYSANNNEVESLSYLHGDHLGSITAITNQAGEVTQRFRYDPFGKQYNMTGVDFADRTPILSRLDMNRGFTGHEMLNTVGLIHMNGRIYDAEVGRFMQADPHIQEPTNNGSLNRYSYVLNNPLSYTDPTGYFFKKLNKLLGPVGMQILGIVIAIATNGATLELWQTMMIGFISGGISTGSLRGAVAGALSAAIMQGVASQGFKGPGRILAHGIAGGVSSKISGGKFGHGFISSAISAGANGMMKDTDPAGKVIVAGAAGGTSSAVTGGKFANGAVSSAFSAAVSEAKTDVSEEGAHKKASELEVSEEGIEFIKRFEGFEVNPYQIENEDGTLGKWTVGYGTEITQEEYDSGNFHNIDKTKGDELLRTRGIVDAQRRMQAFIRTNNPDIKMTQGQYDALISLTYNTGYLGTNRFPKFQSYFKSGNYNGMIKETRDIGQLDGHKARRRAERRMFLFNDYSGKP